MIMSQVVNLNLQKKRKLFKSDLCKEDRRKIQFQVKVFLLAHIIPKIGNFAITIAELTLILRLQSKF
jgi:hypothetical protein